MTTVTGNVKVGTGVPPSTLGAQPSYLLVRSADLVSVGSDTVLPYASRVPIQTDGSFSFTAPALPDGFAYEFIFSINGGMWTSAPRYCTLPASGTVTYRNLTEVSAPNRTTWTQPAWVTDLLALLAAGGGGGTGTGAPGESPQLRVNGGFVQWKLPSDSSWTNLVALADLTGAPGDPGDPGTPGQELSLRKTSTHVQWRLGEGAWTDLIAVSEITGADGAPGSPGTPAEEISLQSTSTHLQWRRGTGEWTNLIALDELRGQPGAAGAAISLQKTATHIQWRLGEGEWVDLVALADITPEGGGQFDGNADVIDEGEDHLFLTPSERAKIGDLGTAAGSNVEDFAPASQGALAVTAMQPGDADAPDAFGLLWAALATRNSVPVPIVFAGGSTIAGQGASSTDRQFAALLTSLLQQAYPLRSGVAQPAFKTLSAAVAALPLAAGVQGIGAGVNGTTAANFLTSTTRAQIGDLAPRMVVIQVGSNDYAGNIAPATFKSNLEGQLAGLRAEIAGPCLFVLAHQYKRGDVTTPTYAWELYGKALQEIADASPDCVFVNTQPYFDQVGVPSPDPFHLIGDTVHPTDAGHAMIAEVLMRALRVPMVGSVATTTPPTGPVVVVQDSFGRADGALGAADTGQAWTTVGSNVIAAGKGSGTGTATVQTDLVNLDISADLTWNGSAVGLVFRSDSNANRLGIFISQGAIIFYRSAASSLTAVATLPFTTTVGATTHVRVVVNGTTMSIYTGATAATATLFNTVTIDQASLDATAGLTRAGWRVSGGGNTVDNFKVKTIA